MVEKDDASFDFRISPRSYRGRGKGKRLTFQKSWRDYLRLCEPAFPTWVSSTAALLGPGAESSSVPGPPRAAGWPRGWPSGVRSTLAESDEAASLQWGGGPLETYIIQVQLVPQLNMWSGEGTGSRSSSPWKASPLGSSRPPSSGSGRPSSRQIFADDASDPGRGRAGWACAAPPRHEAHGEPGRPGGERKGGSDPPGHHHSDHGGDLEVRLGSPLRVATAAESWGHIACYCPALTPHSPAVSCCMGSALWTGRTCYTWTATWTQGPPFCWSTLEPCLR